MTFTLFQQSVAAIAIAGIGLTFLDTPSAQAALLHFSFATDGDGTGSFLLDTDTPVSPDLSVPLTDTDGNPIPEAEGLYYGGAISNFSYSSPGAGSFAYSSLDFVVFPGVPAPPAPSFAAIGTLECTFTPNCPIQLSVNYAGSLAALPKLSDAPGDYTLLVALGYPTGGELTFEEHVKSSNAAGVPEPSVLPGLIAAGAIGGFLRKRLQLRQKRA